MGVHLGGGKREEAGFKAMEEYVQIRQNTVTQFVATRSILDLREETVRTPMVQVRMKWWEQVRIEFTGANERAAADADADDHGVEQ